MVIKDYWTHWDTYADKTDLSGVLLDGQIVPEENYMLFGKHKPILKIAKLLGRGYYSGGMTQLTGPIRGHLCQ